MILWFIAVYFEIDIIKCFGYIQIGYIDVIFEFHLLLDHIISFEILVFRMVGINY